MPVPPSSQSSDGGSRRPDRGDNPFSPLGRSPEEDRSVHRVTEDSDRPPDDGDSDGFDQEEFQQWLQDRRARRGREARGPRYRHRDSIVLGLMIETAVPTAVRLRIGMERLYIPPSRTMPSRLGFGWPLQRPRRRPVDALCCRS